jgi:hypothetical protein
LKTKAGSLRLVVYDETRGEEDFLQLVSGNVYIGPKKPNERETFKAAVSSNIDRFIEKR